MKTCVVETCDREHYGLGYCNPHWGRFVRTGDPQASTPIRVTRSICEVPDCGRKHSCKGLCELHYKRLQRTGIVGLVPLTPATGPRTSNWKGDAVDYPAAHTRLTRRHGSPRQHLCRNCGGQAYDWAYDHLDPNELVAARGRAKGCAYSGKPDHYLPLCRSCHKTLDYAVRRGDLGAVEVLRGSGRWVS